jgi:hypothetical protein
VYSQCQFGSADLLIDGKEFWGCGLCLPTEYVKLKIQNMKVRGLDEVQWQLTESDAGCPEQGGRRLRRNYR